MPDEWLGNIQTSTTKQVRWGSLMRSGTGALKTDSPGCFYPVFVSADKKHFCGAGDVVPVGVDRNTVVVPEGQIAIFPVHSDGTEGRWQYSRDKFLEIQQKGYDKMLIMRDGQLFLGGRIPNVMIHIEILKNKTVRNQFGEDGVWVVEVTDN